MMEPISYLRWKTLRFSTTTEDEDKFAWRVSVDGVDFGSTPGLLYINPQYAVVRIKGHMRWSSRGETSYYGPTYLLFQFLDTNNDVRERITCATPEWSIRAAGVVELNPSANDWRAAERQIISLIPPETRYGPLFVHPPVAKRCKDLIEL